MFCDKFDIRKLLLYLDSTDRGFILLQVNDRRYERELIDLISEGQTTRVYNIYDAEFRATIEESRLHSELKRMVYYGFYLYDDEDLRELLEKINLSRDVLACENKLIFFVVPRYVGRMIQQDYPNLYAYFILKEEYIYKWESLFEYVLPDGDYLHTKTANKEFKSHYQSSENEMELRLEYYSQRKAKEKEYAQLKKDFEVYMNELKNHATEADRRYYYSLLLKMGDVHANQGEYEVAREFFDKIVAERVINAGYQTLYYDVLLHRADTLLKEKNYTDAISDYVNLIVMIEIRNDYESLTSFLEYALKIYPRMAICYARLENHEMADTYLQMAADIAKKWKWNDTCFAILYDRVLLAFRRECTEENQIEPLFKELESYIYNEIQEVMYYIVNAWYCGVVEGYCTEALRFVKAALSIGRGILPENNPRIAECHYINSILYRFMEDLEKSDICKEKCINILENYDVEEDRIQRIKEVLD